MFGELRIPIVVQCANVSKLCVSRLVKLIRHSGVNSINSL